MAEYLIEIVPLSGKIVEDTTYRYRYAVYRGKSETPESLIQGAYTESLEDAVALSSAVLTRRNVEKDLADGIQ